MELKPKNVHLLSGHEAARILKAGRGELTISLDLGHTYERALCSEEGLEALDILLPWDKLEEMADDPEAIYTFNENPRKLAFYSGKYYRLIQPLWGHAPTLEINGIRMHRTTDISPELDASSKVALMDDLQGKTVLDICTGLGYTAIEEVRRGAERVTTVEADINVLELATYNPWSKPLFSSGVELMVADAATWLDNITEKFDAVMLDPPTIRSAGRLYSLEFYRKLASVIRKNGVLVHYVGEPGRRRGERVYVGVLARLRAAGFRAAYKPSVRCVKAYKV
ncbi:MAG: RsmD family RNA methyltransferase [Nitrososphaerota archaeon]